MATSTTRFRSTLLLILALVAACRNDPRIDIGEPQGSRYAARGRELFKGLAACGFCHGEKNDPRSAPTGGRRQWDTYGEVYAANLTPDPDALGGWNVQQIMHAVRASRGRDGEVLSEDVHQGYEWMADADLLAIVAYLKGLPAMKNDVARREVNTFDRNTTGFWEGHDEQTGFVPQIDERYQVEYGKYLLDNVARCGFCHSKPATVLTSSEYLGGGRTIKTEEGEKFAPSLTNSGVDGIGQWSEADLVHYLQSGETPEGKASDPNFCPTNFFRNAAERDLQAIAKYLKSR